MTLLALPGRKPQTLPWMQALLADLGTPDAPIQRYRFWAHADISNPDIEPEITAASASSADLVIAKSIGTLIAMLARRDRGLAAQAYVFVGTPVRRLAGLGQLDLLAAQASAAPTLFIQQTADPGGGFAELAARLPEAAALREVPGDNHAYADTHALAALIAAWRPSLVPGSRGR